MAKKQTFTEQLRRAVRESGLSRYAISKQTGIPECTLSRFVVGGTGLSARNLDVLVDALGLELVPRVSRKRAKKGGK